MSWKDRATKVEDAPAEGGWRSRAVPAENQPTQQTSLKDEIRSYLTDTAKSAKREVGSIVRGAPAVAESLLRIGDLPASIVRRPAERAFGIPENETSFAKSMNVVKAMPGAAFQGVLDTAHNFMHPVDSFRQGPISTLANIASVAVPVAKGAMALKAAPAMEIAAKSAAAGVAPSLGRKVLAKTVRGAFGVPEEATLARMENPAAIKTAFNHHELADQMTESVGNFTKTLKDFGEDAAKTLRASPYIEEGAIPKTKVMDVVKSARRQIGGAYGADAKAAAKALKSVSEDFKKLKSTVAETQIKGIIQKLDDNINWNNPAASSTNEALIGVRRKLDGILKGQNPDYKEAMVPVDEGTRVLNKIQQTFGIQRETARGFFPGDQTVNKIKRALKEDKLGTQGVLKRFEKISGEDWTTKIKNANAREAFESIGHGMGSSRSNAGTSVGAAVGGAIGGWSGVGVGGAVGSIAGIFSDIYGPRVAAKIVDSLANPALSRYVGVLKNAAASGAKNLAATHAHLLQTDKDYAAAMSASGVGK